MEVKRLKLFFTFCLRSFRVTLQVAGLNEIKQWVMGLGPEAEVLEPKQLKELIQQDLKQTLAKYEKGTHEIKPAISKHKTYNQDNRIRMRKQNF